MVSPRKRKILFAIDSLGGGGAERVMAELANALDPARYDVEIVMTLGTARVQEIAPHVKVSSLAGDAPQQDTRSLPRKALGAFVSSLPLLPYVETMRRIMVRHGAFIKASHPDCVISFLANTNLLTLAARSWCGLDVPVICADHIILSSDMRRLRGYRLRRLLTRHYYPRATRHVAVSPASRDDLIAKWRVPPDCIETILNGIDLARVRKLASSAPARDGVPRIVSAGRLNYAKGFDVLLRAMARLKTERWELLLIGDGEERPKLEALANELGIAGHVQFLGWRTNPYEWMAQCDLYVLSSRWEALPLILLEALALGLPVVATRASSGPAEVLGEGRYGRLVPPAAPDALAQAIDELLADAPRRNELASLARERANAFDLPPMVQAYERLIEAVCSDAR
jgi:glycosyltransferase involved in cell wall biosynthesis